MKSPKKKAIARSPIKALFAFLMLAIVAGFILFSSKMWDEVSSSAESEMEFVNRLLIQTTHEVFNHQQSMLRVLGGRLLELDAGRYPERGRVLIDQMRRINPAMAGFGLARPDGQLVLVSGIKPGIKLPNLMTQPESAKSFREVLNTGQMQSGRTYFMPLLQRWVIPIRVAITDDIGDIPLVMSAGIDLDAEEATWNALTLPEDFEVRILRPDGYWQFVKPLSNKQKSAVYGETIDSDLYEKITTHHAEDNRLTFDYAGRLYFVSYIKQWNLYSVVSLPRTFLISRLASNLSIPTLLLAALIVVGVIFYTVASREQLQYEASLIKQATYDSLTLLPNRNLAMDRLEQAIVHAHRGGKSVAVIYLDLDNFKRINDGFGHLVGDELLTQCAKRLQTTIRAGDTVARLGGDEFLIILPSLNNIDASDLVLRKIHAALEVPFVIDQREIFAHCSMGVALYPEDGQATGDLLKAADTALYKAKDSGRKTHCFYSQQMNDEAERRVELEAALRYALEKNELYLAYQPQVDLRQQRWIGAEVLLRWHSEKLGEVGPVEFIPVAEETGLIGEIGEYVIHQACQALTKLQPYIAKDFVLAINISPWQLREIDFIDTVEMILHRYQCLPSQLEFEITESILVDSPEQLFALQELGVTVAVDDFGTGFSSLSYLSKFPINTLKIDRAFVRDIETDPQDANLARAIINMGGSLGLEIVAEGIETAGQLAFLQASGCQYGQGYYFSKPVLLEALMALLQRPHASQA